MDTNEKLEKPVEDDARRDFLKKCGKFAVYTAPAMAALLMFDKKNANANGGGSADD